MCGTQITHHNVVIERDANGKYGIDCWTPGCDFFEEADTIENAHRIAREHHRGVQTGAVADDKPRPPATHHHIDRLKKRIAELQDELDASLRVGDKMQFSGELMNHLDETTYPEAFIVKVERITAKKTFKELQIRQA